MGGLNKLFKGYHWSKNDLSDQNNFSKVRKLFAWFKIILQLNKKKLFDDFSLAD